MILDFVALSAADLFNQRLGFLSRAKPVAEQDQPHLDAAVSWLLRSFESTGQNGSSMAYAFLSGWRPAYPETTGYIISTLLRLAEHKADPALIELARKQGDWLLSIQADTGAIQGRSLAAKEGPIVFNTGQVLLGLNDLFAKTGDQKYLDGAVRAGDFLVGCMDDTGCFVRHLHHNIVHTYNVRVAWALIQLGQLSGQPRFEEAGKHNVRWALTQQSENGYFAQNNFKPGGNAITHSIGYVLRGILESYSLCGNPEYFAAVELTGERLIKKYGIRRRLVSEIGPDWEDLSSHLCLTGYAQLAIVFLKAFRINRDERYLNIALHLIDDLKSHQYMGKAPGNFRGAIKGSFPIYGAYAPLQFPNWATKFFIDALLFKAEALSEYESRILS